IRNAVQILQRAPDEQTLRRTSEMLERQVGLMAHLINDLLDVSRISLGKIELRMQRTQISSVVQFAIETVRPLYESKRQQLTVTMPPEPIFVMGDGARLAQIIGNLLNNACKFTKREGRIRLSVQRDAGQVLILVEDNGIGIAADQLTRIFEMFTQVDTSLERSNGGLGIGLTLVKTLVDLHGGSAEAQSAGSGKGSLLIVRLPVLLEAPPQAGSDSPRTAQEPAQRRILVVDDNRDSAESLAMLL